MEHVSSIQHQKTQRIGRALEDLCDLLPCNFRVSENAASNTGLADTVGPASSKLRIESLITFMFWAWVTGTVRTLFPHELDVQQIN